MNQNKKGPVNHNKIERKQKLDKYLDLVREFIIVFFILLVIVVPIIIGMIKTVFRGGLEKKLEELGIHRRIKDIHTTTLMSITEESAGVLRRRDV